ncbi:DUF3299 domain-containing protein [Marivita sp. S0852]|uniref:DUF3299 domain-containing protein n=1 Tax=Marivita sp. S0852 TaxID=3373893 RepID=UPI003981EEA3
MTGKLVRIGALLLLAALPAAAGAEDARQIGWATLAPPAPEIENPFERLTPAQMDSLRLILRAETRAEATGDDSEIDRARELRQSLTADGIDADALFAARVKIMETRQQAASRVNQDLVGTHVRMPGYVLPLAFEGRKAVEFLLVPTVGACVHTPPPPANQVVHVHYPEGIEVTGLFNPVWIDGVMQAESAQVTVGYVDGRAPVSVSYAMQPKHVEAYGG